MSLQPAPHILPISLHPRCLPSNLIQTLIEESIEFLPYLISSIPFPNSPLPFRIKTYTSILPPKELLYILHLLSCAQPIRTQRNNHPAHNRRWLIHDAFPILLHPFP
jgi:hypothetical protein